MDMPRSSRSSRPAPGATRELGATLAELLVAVLIASVLAGIAAPSWDSYRGKTHVVSASNAFLASLYRARSEAIKRHARVVLCKSSDTESCAGEGGWEQGWIVFHDTNNNGLREPIEIVLERQQGFAGRLRLTGNSSVRSYVSFASTGATKLTGGGFQAGTLTICRESPVPAEGRQIIVNAAGRPRVHQLTLPFCP